VTYGDRTTDRRAYTCSAAGARHGIDSATIAGTAGAPAKEGESEPKQCPELFHASLELQDLLLEFRRPQVCHVQAHHGLRCLAEPPTGGRARDSEVRGNGHVPGPLDEIPKPVVVALLRAPRGRHEDDHGAIRSRRSTPQGHCGAIRRHEMVHLSDANSRDKVQNVRGGSSAARRGRSGSGRWRLHGVCGYGSALPPSRLRPEIHTDVITTSASRRPA